VIVLLREVARCLMSIPSPEAVFMITHLSRVNRILMTVGSSCQLWHRRISEDRSIEVDEFWGPVIRLAHACSSYVCFIWRNFTNNVCYIICD